MEWRSYCYRCMRAEAMCLCRELPRCHNGCEIHILQHPREGRHAFNTVRLLKVALQNLRVYALPPNGGAKISVPEAFPMDAGLLYPGPDSRDLLQLPKDELPKKLVVIDGTWSQAHCMFRDSPWLQALPRFRLNPKEASAYKIRKEPRFECLSTLESTVMALQAIEPDTPGLEEIHRAFVTMNERQLERMAENRDAPPRIKRRRRKISKAVPELLWEEPERIVVVYGESAQPARRRDKKSREIAQWCALRFLDAGRMIHRIVRTKVPMPNSRFREDLEWESEGMEQAVPVEVLKEEWRAFLKPDDLVVAWNKGTLRLAKEHGLIGESVMLKEVYGNITKENFGTLDDVVQHLKLDAPKVEGVHGRAALRLGQAYAICSYLSAWGKERACVQ